MINKIQRIKQKLIKTTKNLKAGVLAVALLLAPLSALAESYTLNFKDTDIKDLIKFVADATGYTVIIDPKVKAKVNVISQKSVNEKELYQDRQVPGQTSL